MYCGKKNIRVESNKVVVSFAERERRARERERKRRERLLSCECMTENLIYI